MKKRLVSVLLCGAMTASLLMGCGGGSASSEEESGGDSEGKTTLTFWCHDNAPWVEAYKEMAAKFEEEYPEIHDQFEEITYKIQKKVVKQWLLEGKRVDISLLYGEEPPRPLSNPMLCLKYRRICPQR